MEQDHDTDRLHRINCHSTWPACPGYHQAPDPRQAGEQVKDCYRKSALPGAWPCGWLIPAGLSEDGEPVILPCDAAATYRDNGDPDAGYVCEAGHENTPAWTRQAQGWDYAGDPVEARRMAGAGVEPRQMNGQAWAW